MLTQIAGWTALFAFIVYIAYPLSVLHPLHHIPGPWWTAISSAWLQYHTIRGTQARATQALHRRYGPVVRVAPNEVEIADGQALWPIYVKNGGFDKSHHYAPLDIDGRSTIFSTLQNRKRAERLKIALPYFSSASVSRQVSMMEGFAHQLVQQLDFDKTTSASVDLLDRCRCYAVDTTCSYVFDEAFGALREGRLSITPVVDAFVEVNLLFNVPSQLYRLVSYLYDTFVVRPEVKHAESMVDQWIRTCIAKKAKGKDSGLETYPERLAASGLPADQVIAEGKDAIFGATDALGLTLSLILWRLVSTPEVHKALRQELESNSDIKGDQLKSLPILTGVIKESMRISSTVPCKLPRLVPPEGLSYNDVFIPGGTIVGVAPYMLHMNEKVFPEPQSLLPERWSSATQEMNRDWMPFGKGARACMGRHLAFMQVCIAVASIVRSGVLSDARTTVSEIQFWEWYNVEVKEGRIEIEWK